MIFAHVFSSMGIGLLIGILLGLSTSPVVGMVVGSVTALLASILGLDFSGKTDEQDKNTSRFQNQVKMVGIRAGVFGFACVIGVFIGIYVRTHNLLSPPQPGLTEKVAELVSVGFTQKEARDLVVVGHLSAETESTAGSPSASDSVLFAISAENCEMMSVDLFADFEALSNAYKNLGIEELARVVEAVDANSSDEQGKMVIMNAVVETVCSED